MNSHAAGTEPGPPPPRLAAVRRRVLEEARRFAVMFGYLWVLFGLLSLHERIILKEEGINFAAQGLALVNALVLAKVMLVAENLKITGWLKPRPLIFPILGEALIFTALFIAFHVAEHAIIGAFESGRLTLRAPSIGGGGLAGILSVAMILFVALIPFFGFRNVSRALGPGRLTALLFDKMAK